MAPPGYNSKKTTTSKSSSTSGGPPGFTSKKTTSKSSSTSGGPPGTSSGKSSQDILKDLKKEISRREYFKGREDVSDDRLLRRYEQAEQQRKYKQDLVRQGKYVTDSQGKPVRTASGDYVYTGTATFDTDTSSPTFGKYVSYGVTDKAKELANKYGPTFSEIGSDMGYAFGSMARGAGDILKSGSFGILGAIKGIANYALDKANKGYDKLNDVQKYVFDNADRFTFASKVPQVDEVSKAEELALQADRDALGLELDTLIAQREADRFRYENPTVDMRAPTREDLEALDTTDVGYVESGQFKQDLQNSGILSVDDPSTGEPLPDNTKIPGQESTIGDFKQALENQGFNELQIKSAVNEITRQILSGTYTGDFDVETGSTTTDDQVSFTPYDNPFNLEFRGQEGAEPGYGGPEGTRFASFDTLDRGLTAGISRVAEIVGEGKSTDDFLNIYAPRSDNPESYDNYLSVLQEKVGPTIEPDEIKPLTEGIVRFENKPKLADQYLNYLEKEKDKLYSGIVS